jgi:UDP-glucose 4-epimerase
MGALAGRLAPIHYMMMQRHEFRDRKVLVTGAAGFIGSTVVDRLLGLGAEVVGYDNLSTGFPEFLAPAEAWKGFTFIKGDVLDGELLKKSLAGVDLVFHFAANADVRFGLLHPKKDLEQNTLATFSLLEAMRGAGVKRIAFSSTGSIYGDAAVVPTPEDAPFPLQTSLYGASKLAAEGLIAAFCEGYGMRAWIFRFVSILGERYSHGHVFDFYKKLLADPTRLPVLGNGRQRKSYLHVQDCIDAMLLAVSRAADNVNIFNLGTDEYCEVNDSISWITEHLGLAPKLDYSGGERGWVGDNPFIFLDTARIKKLGWRPRLTIRDGIIATLRWLQENRWAMERRP